MIQRQAYRPDRLWQERAEARLPPHPSHDRIVTRPLPRWGEGKTRPVPGMRPFPTVKRGEDAVDAGNVPLPRCGQVKTRPVPGMCPSLAMWTVKTRPVPGMRRFPAVKRGEIAAGAGNVHLSRGEER